MLLPPCPRAGCLWALEPQLAVAAQEEIRRHEFNWHQKRLMVGVNKPNWETGEPAAQGGCDTHPGKALRLVGCWGVATMHPVWRHTAPHPDVLCWLQMCTPTLLPSLQMWCLGPDALALGAVPAPDVHTHGATPDPDARAWLQICTPAVLPHPKCEGPWCCPSSRCVPHSRSHPAFLAQPQLCHHRRTTPGPPQPCRGHWDSPRTLLSSLPSTPGPPSCSKAHLQGEPPPAS